LIRVIRGKKNEVRSGKSARPEERYDFENHSVNPAWRPLLPVSR
jgi:hypothetical protein